METNVEYTAYHGTSADKADKVMKYGFKMSSHGWLGTGVYFYENNVRRAAEWARNRTNNVSVIKAQIKVERNRILDLTVPHSDSTDSFHQYRSDFIEAAHGRGALATLTNSDLDGVIINKLCADKGYKLVRSNTYTYSKFDREMRLNSRIPNGTELCLRDIKLIFNKEYVENVVYMI